MGSYPGTLVSLNLPPPEPLLTVDIHPGKAIQANRDIYSRSYFMPMYACNPRSRRIPPIRNSAVIIDNEFMISRICTGIVCSANMDYCRRDTQFKGKETQSACFTKRLVCVVPIRSPSYQWKESYVTV